MYCNVLCFVMLRIYCNVAYCLHKREIVMCSASAELCALYCLHERGIVMCSASAELCALY